MDANPVGFPATNVWHRNRTAGNPRETPLTLALHEAGCVYRGSRWCVGLAIPVVFNDVGMLEKPAGNRREVHQDYCANREIRRDDPSKGTVSTRPSKFLQVAIRDATRRHHRPDPAGKRRKRMFHCKLGERRLKEDIRTRLMDHRSDITVARHEGFTNPDRLVIALSPCDANDFHAANGSQSASDIRRQATEARNRDAYPRLPAHFRAHGSSICPDPVCHAHPSHSHPWTTKPVT